MINATRVVRSRQRFRVTLKRKPTINEHQNSMEHVVEVRAEDREEAKRLALQMPQNAAYQVKSVREIR